MEKLNARNTRVQRTSKQLRKSDTPEQMAEVKRRNSLLETELYLISFINEMKENSY